MFSFEKLSVLARSIVDALIEGAPPSKVAARGGISARKVSRAVENAVQLAVAEQKGDSFGYFSRVILASKLRVLLKKASYDDEFSNLVVEGLLVELSRAAGGSK